MKLILSSSGIHSKYQNDFSAEQIVSAQPMSLPSNLIFFLDYQYGANNKDGKNK